MHRHKDKRFQGALEYLVKGSFTKDKKKKVLFREAQLNGIELDMQWKQYSKKLESENRNDYTIQSFSFKNRDVSKFTPQELFDVFNFYRLYATRIDTQILAQFERQELLNFCLTKYKETYGMPKKKVYKLFYAKFRRTSLFELNIDFLDEEIEKAYNGV